MRRRSIAVTLLAVLALALVVQWLAFHMAEESLKSLPCDTRLAPYTLEVESLFPPYGLLKNATGYCLDGGDVEAVVPGRLGHYSPGYEYILWSSEWDMNYSIALLKESLKRGDPGRIKDDFYWVKINYFKLKLAREYEGVNITEIRFAPSPPLGWAHVIKMAILTPLEDPSICFWVVGVVLSAVVYGVLLLGLNLGAKLPHTNSAVKPILVALFIILVLQGALGDKFELFKHFGLEDGETSPGISCSVNDTYSLLHEFHRMARGYVGNDEATCEVLQNLRSTLAGDEFDALQKTLNVSCT